MLKPQVGIGVNKGLKGARSKLQSSGPPLNRLSSEDSVPKGGWTVWMAKAEYTAGKQVKHSAGDILREAPF